jgi:UDP-N-acetyl-D-mannosaminuronic acid dehydrogenase
MSTLALVGLGYVGLPTALMLASNGWDVVGVDTSGPVIDAVNAGSVPFLEVGFPELLATAVSNGRLSAQREMPPADVFIVAVPTPINADKSSDVSAVESVCRHIAPLLAKRNLVIVESTVPPLATREIVVPLLEAGGLAAGSDFFVAYCPERVLPGDIMREIVENDRIVGGITPESTERAAELYETFATGQIHKTDDLTAELAKLSENTFRDINIAFANELAAVSEKLGADAWEVIRLANRHPRVDILNPGPGVGGHCIPVDPWFLHEAAPENTALIETARRVNDAQPDLVASQVAALCDGDLAGRRIAILGVAYKANVGDARESPALRLIESLTAGGAEVSVYDPHVSTFPHPLVGMDAALKNADVVVVVTDHDSFLALEPTHAAALVRRRVVLDTRAHLDGGLWGAAGFTVRTIGRGQ